MSDNIKMADVLRRLRSIQNDCSQYAAGSDIIRDAADTIDRLTAENDALNEQLEDDRKTATEWSNEGGAEIQRLREEVERLQKAGQALEADYSSYRRDVEHKQDYWNGVQQERDQLKVALNEANSRLNQINETFYGERMAVVGWHLNGDHEPIDNFFDENSWEPVNANVSLAAHDADVIEREIEWLHTNYPHLCGPHLGILTHRANQLRQQAKDVQS